VPRYEVFGRHDHQEGVQHAGTVDAPNPELGILQARQCFARRGEADEIWLVESHAVHRFRAEQEEGTDKSYREIQSYADIGRKRRLVEANIPATKLSEQPSLSSSGPDLTADTSEK
jgi:ring-1,2-phenylacetyl-CoA epoxidase subunit PaaB